MQESDISPATSGPTQTTPIGVALRGVCMGLAELVPGISGGTIAFVTGIYSELVTALASFGPQSIGLLRHPQAFWQQHNLGFLLSLSRRHGCRDHRAGAGGEDAAGPSSTLVMGVLFWGDLGFRGLHRARSRAMTLLRYGTLGAILGVAFLSLPIGQMQGLVACPVHWWCHRSVRVDIAGSIGQLCVAGAWLV